MTYAAGREITPAAVAMFLRGLGPPRDDAESDNAPRRRQQTLGKAQRTISPLLKLVGLSVLLDRKQRLNLDVLPVRLSPLI